VSPRSALLAVLAYQFAALAILCMAVAVTLRGLINEIADEVRASRNENRNNDRPGGDMPIRNRKVRDYDSTNALRFANDALAAQVGCTQNARAMLSDARQLATELALPARRSW